LAGGMGRLAGRDSELAGGMGSFVPAVGVIIGAVFGDIVAARPSAAREVAPC
jgi:hypothetical protein